MINLTTGAPGAGKTLFSLYYIAQLAEKENRQVYYSGVTDLKKPWIELEDPAKWYEVPAGSIVVIDECQRLFRPRGNGAAVPEYVARLETHRHQGIDLFLITQHPMLVDNNVRRLVGAHRHVVRSFGMQRCTVHEWGSVKVDCDKNRSDSVRHEVSYPKEVFTWYKSAEVHTVKRRIPPRLFLLLALPLLLAGLAYGAYAGLAKYSGKKPEATTPGGQLPLGQAAPATPGVPGGSGLRQPGHNPVIEKVAWFEARAPRVSELAYTAPIYDELTKPVEAPAPVACLRMGERCDCFTQQGVRIKVEKSTCEHIVKEGIHLDWRPLTVAQADTRKGSRRPAEAPQAVQ